MSNPIRSALESMEKINDLFVLVLAVMVAETRERKNGGTKERAGVVVGRGAQGGEKKE
jgi:hypothetical protein